MKYHWSKITLALRSALCAMRPSPLALRSALCALLFLVFALCAMRSAESAYNAHTNFASGTIYGTPLLSSASTGSTFTVKLDTNASTFPSSGEFNVIVYTSVCANPETCSKREFIHIISTAPSGSNYLFTIGTGTLGTGTGRNQESTTHSADWGIGSHVKLVFSSKSLTDMEDAIDTIVAGVTSWASITGTAPTVNGYSIMTNPTLTPGDVGADASGAAATVQGNLDVHTGQTGTNVHGLGTASTHAEGDFETAGAAATVQGNLTTHTGQTGTNVHGLGTASTHAEGDFETAGAAATVQGNLTTHTGQTGTNVHGLGTASTHAEGDFRASDWVPTFAEVTSKPTYTCPEGQYPSSIDTQSGVVTCVTDSTGVSNFADLEGLPGDNAALASALGLKSNTTHTHALADLADDTTHRVVTDAEKSGWDAKQAALTAGVDYLAPTGDSSGLSTASTTSNGIVTAATYSKIANPLYYRVYDVPGNPLIWDATNHRRDPSRILHIGSSYYMWYSKLDAAAANSGDIENSTIACASAPDKWGPWTEQGSVLSKSVSGWDDKGVFTPNVEYSGSTVYVFYTAVNTLNDYRAIGVATVSDATPCGALTKEVTNPVIDNWPARRVVDGISTLKIADGSWRAYFKCNTVVGANNRQTCLATTPTGSFPVGWTLYDSGNPIFGLTVNGSPNIQNETPAVYIVNGVYAMKTNAMSATGTLTNDNWYESADGITDWSLSNTFESISTRPDWHDYAIGGSNTSPIDGDFYYITTSGQPDVSTKMGIGLYKIVRTQGSPPTILNETAAFGSETGADRIAAGNSSVKVTDTGTGSIAFTLDGSVVSTATPSGVGIGITPTDPLHIDTTSINPTVSAIHVEGNRGKEKIVMDSYGGGTGSTAIVARYAGGTKASPTAVTDGTTLLQITAQGHDGSAFGLGAKYTLFSSGTWSTTNHGGYHSWFVTPLNSTTNSEVMRLTSAGKLGIGTTAPASTLEVNGDLRASASEVISTSTATLTASQVRNTIINSYGRSGAVTNTLPAAAAGYNFNVIVGTQHNSAWKFQRQGSDTIIVDGTASKTYFQETNQAVGSSISCWTFQTGASAWTWKCRSESGTWATD